MEVQEQQRFDILYQKSYCRNKYRSNRPGLSYLAPVLWLIKPAWSDATSPSS